MKLFERISKEVHGNMDENTHVVNAAFGCIKDPCPPCHFNTDDWFWHKDLKLMMKYIFEFVLGGMTLNELMYFNVIDDNDETDYTFLELIDLYLHGVELEDNEKEDVKNLKELYLTIDKLKELTYVDFIKYCLQIEDYAVSINTDVAFRTYYTPFEARYDEAFRNYSNGGYEFDNDNLLNNFSDYVYQETNEIKGE